MRILLTAAGLVGMTTCADAEPVRLLDSQASGFEVRYRFEHVDQDDEPLPASANTARLRLRGATTTLHGLSALVEIDRVQVLGAEKYDDTRNGRSDRPVVADPEGTDLNQAYIQFASPIGTTMRLGRQRISLDDERFVGAVGWRQNEQTFDAVRIESRPAPGVVLNYALVSNTRRIFGPDAGIPPAELRGTSHLLHARLGRPSGSTITLHGYHLDFDNAPQLSSDTFGIRYDRRMQLGDGARVDWLIAYARQSDAGARRAHRDADYRHFELGLHGRSTGLRVGLEILSGRQGAATTGANPAFQTPLATLHKWQGWADKFLTTPPAGVRDLYAGIDASVAGWSAQVIWHGFSSSDASRRFGREIDLALSRKIADRYEVMAKYAAYDADGLFTDTRKLWLQVSVSL